MTFQTKLSRARRATKAGRCMDLFGGARAMGQACGIDPKTIYRWTDSAAGSIPTSYNMKIIEGARRVGINVAGLVTLLDEHKCPTCGQTLPVE